MKTEQRHVPRLPSSRPVVFLLNQQNNYATMTDFSKNGLGFVTDATLHEHERIEVHFDVEKEEGIQSFQFKAEVKHCTPANQRSHVGVKFDMPSQAYQQLYAQLAAK